MGFVVDIARFRIGLLRTVDLPQVALAAMEEGFDSTSLVVLAGKDGRGNAYVLEEYFHLALAELSLSFPDDRQARLMASAELAEQILYRDRGLLEGVEAMNTIFQAGTFNEETKTYVYDSIGYEQVYGAYWTLKDLMEATSSWQPGKSNAELLIECQVEVRTALARWLERRKNGDF